MKWITREKARVDRIACPWLVSRFVDKAPTFLFVPDREVMAVAEREGAIPYDVPGVELGHKGERCSFDAFLDKYRLDDPALGALALLGLGLAIRPIRVRWRPFTGAVGLAVSRGLRPGARAWYVRARDADVVLVTARRGLRLVIARPDLVSGEGMSVRRTRVLLLPAEAEDRR